MSNNGLLKAVFFDLGDTLVTGDRRWIPGAKDVLSQLRAKGVSLGLISNTSNFTRDQLRGRLPVDFDFGLFDHNLIVLSSEVMVEKPSLEIFRLAIRRSAAQPQECLFCTEELPHTLAAQRAGMVTARLRPPSAASGNTTDITELVDSLLKVGLL